jgi:ATP synthase protein I
MHKFPINRAIACQSLIWLASVVLTAAALGVLAGYSVALGGLISLFPGIWFMMRYFRLSGARAMERVVRNAFVGEAVKLVQMVVGFALVFALVRPLSPLAVLSGFVVVQVAGVVITSRLASRNPV